MEGGKALPGKGGRGEDRAQKSAKNGAGGLKPIGMVFVCDFGHFEGVFWWILLIFGGRRSPLRQGGKRGRAQKSAKNGAGGLKPIGMVFVCHFGHFEGVSSILLIFGGRQSPPSQGGKSQESAKNGVGGLAVLNLSEWSSCYFSFSFHCSLSISVYLSSRVHFASAL